MMTTHKGVAPHVGAWIETVDRDKKLNLTNLCNKVFQSTHPHGVRHANRFADMSNDMFQSTHPHGVRHIIMAKQNLFVPFQSTHPHGVRPPPVRICKTANTSFNPRTHMGCDGSLIAFSYYNLVSIHAPTWGATFALSNIKIYTYVSIHAPTWGATLGQ